MKIEIDAGQNLPCCFRRKKTRDGSISRDSNRQEKERGARKRHKRLLYCVNVNRTSLDHLLLGEYADVDKVSHAQSISSATFQNKPFLALVLLISLDAPRS
jgi:hypothetical protein